MGLFGKLFGKKSRGETPLDKDARLERVIGAVLDCCEYVVFAGDGAADMAERVARRHSDKECLACEPGSDTYYDVTNRTAKVKNLYLFNKRPREFFLGLKHEKPYLLERDTLVVINVPGGGSERRVFLEAGFVAQNFRAPFLLLLGCRVPGDESFGYDSHRGRECSFPNLKPHLSSAPYSIYFPAYKAPHSRGRAVKGWCLASMGRNAHHMFTDEMASLIAKPDAKSAPREGYPGKGDSKGAADKNTTS